SFVLLKPFFMAALENSSLSFSSSLAFSYLAWHLSQQKPTSVSPTLTIVSLFTGFPVNGQATCLIWPGSDHWRFTCPASFLSFFLRDASNAFGQLSQQK